MPARPRRSAGVTALTLTEDEAIVIHQRRNWCAASPFATHDRDGRPFKYATKSSLDPGIAPFVKILYDHGVETYESCQGGPDPARPGRGHAYLEPTIAFHGGPEAGPRAFGIAQMFDLPVADLRRVWRLQHHELNGPHWEMSVAESHPIGVRRLARERRLILAYRTPVTGARLAKLTLSHSLQCRFPPVPFSRCCALMRFPSGHVSLS